jgi:hypothetical protein
VCSARQPDTDAIAFGVFDVLNAATGTLKHALQILGVGPSSNAGLCWPSQSTVSDSGKLIP